MFTDSIENASEAPLGATSLERALDGIFITERRTATRNAALVRVGMSFAILAIIWIRRNLYNGDLTWGRPVLPLFLYFTGSLTFFALRDRPFMDRLAWLVGVFDVAAIGLILFDLHQHARIPPGVAMFTLGLLALVITTNAVRLTLPSLFVVTALAALCEGWLLRTLHIDWGGVVISWAVLFVIAGATWMNGGRLRTVLAGLAREEARNSKLAALQREKETLTQVLVHDLRSPMNAVILMLEFIRRGLNDAALRPDLQRSATSALGAARRTTRMINDLLEVARLEEKGLTPQRTMLEASDLCSELQRQFDLLAGRRALAFEMDVTDGLRLPADRALLIRVLENLLSNALRFAAHRIRLSGTREGTEVVFRVQNDGPPISPEAQARLFQKFAQDHREEGWGLGLYFCRLAAEAHGGSIRVEHVQDWSVSFVVRLPAEAVQNTSAAA